MPTNNNFFKGATAPNLDDLLLDIATSLELSPRDRRVADNRYRKLKEHLERLESPLAPYLADSESRIYPQGSISTGTIIVNGDDDDRFDVDALVELNVPADWPPSNALDLLYEALKDFPDAVHVERCTRCVQIQFAFMHMDVTVMDPEKAMRVERAGEIFHSPDEGKAYRVPANPYGFSLWFRGVVDTSNTKFAEAISKRRATHGIDRLSTGVATIKAAEQDDLPDIIPPQLDSEQVVAHKLLKRYLNRQYQDRSVKKPPSVFQTKMAGDVEAVPYGLCAQLSALALHIRNEMQQHVSNGTMPDERNPSYQADRLNDRWPQSRRDMEILVDDMDHFLAGIEQARDSDFKQIVKIFSGLFGERVTTRSADFLLERAEALGSGSQSEYERGTGAVVAAAVAAPAIVRSREPEHNFHCTELKRK